MVDWAGPHSDSTVPSVPILAGRWQWEHSWLYVLRSFGCCNTNSKIQQFYLTILIRAKSLFFLCRLLVCHFVLTICFVHTTSSSRTVQTVPERCSEALDWCFKIPTVRTARPIEHSPPNRAWSMLRAILLYVVCRNQFNYLLSLINNRRWANATIKPCQTTMLGQAKDNRIDLSLR